MHDREGGTRMLKEVKIVQRLDRRRPSGGSSRGASFFSGITILSESLAAAGWMASRARVCVSHAGAVDDVISRWKQVTNGTLFYSAQRGGHDEIT